MKGIEIFLVLKEKGKDVCYLEYTTVKYNDNLSYSVMHRFGKKNGISLTGRGGEKEILTAKLLKYYKKMLDEERRELNKRNDLFKRLNENC